MIKGSKKMVKIIMCRHYKNGKNIKIKVVLCKILKLR